ncbi:conserved membrane domain protein [Mycobacterium xenopi 3993]|nr:conserved membrane domain protein [Mycobacterium xenopi 3993]
MAQLTFLVVAAFLLTNKVWSPQFSLWLVPLAVLALPHRRILLAWMTIDAVVWVPRMYYLYSMPNRGLPEQWFTAAVLLRDAAVVLLCVLVVRQIYRPSEDLVRWGGRLDDPAGGVFDRAADAPPAGCRPAATAEAAPACGRRLPKPREHPVACAVADAGDPPATDPTVAAHDHRR